MTKPLSRKAREFFAAYPLWVLFLLLLSLLLRLVEHFSMATQLPDTNRFDTFLYGLLNDVGFALSAAAILFPPLLALWCWKSKAAVVAFSITGCLFILANAALNRYYLTTRTLLGADLFGYSMHDIRTTVGSSTSFSFTDLLPVLLLVAFIFGIVWTRKRQMQWPALLTAAFVPLGLCCTFFYNAFAEKKDSPSRQQLTLCKGAYFVMDNLATVKPHQSKTLKFEGYPALHNDNSTDALTPFFNLQAEKPNIVFLIVEGLGRDFTGPSAQYGGFMPFLDSLSQKGLYWSNFLSSAGRSFAGLPSILGSLPFGKNGFNEMGQGMPDHLSLVSLLKKNGYRTTYFYGGNSNFDNQDIFLERQGIDYIVDDGKFGRSYSRDFGSKYSWGYADGDLYKHSLEVMQEAPKQPLLNVYFTLSTHEPFALPNEPLYEQKVAARIAQMSAPDKDRYTPYKDVWKALVYSDESIRSFFEAYQKRPDYANTVFFITGDHRLIPVEEQHPLSRFHVPLLVYSPMLKHSAVFPALSSHFDITPSLMQMLRHNSDMKFPSEVAWMGQGLDTSAHFNESYEVPLMRIKGVVNDYIQGTTLASGNELYRIKENLELEAMTDAVTQKLMSQKLDSFRQLNTYLCSQNRLLKFSANAGFTANSAPAFSPTEQKKVDSLRVGLTGSDTLFSRARQLAFSGHYEEARLLCRYVLAKSPNYHDVRILFGRTYAWNKQYEVAAASFAEVLRRNPAVEDAYLAWIDDERWAGRKDSALLLTQKGLKLLPDSKDLKEREAKLTAKR